MLENFLKRAGIIISLILLIWMSAPVLTFAQSYDDSGAIYLEWLNDPTRTIIINWVDKSTSNLTVQYRRRDSGSGWTNVNATISDIPDLTTKRKSSQIFGLSPNTTYEFRVGGSNTSHFFRTLPNDLTNPINFLITGDVYGYGHDPGLDTAIFQQMASTARRENPLFAVLAGDIIHQSSVTTQLEVDYMIRLLKFIYEWYVEMRTDDGLLIPIVAGLGNHETAVRFGGSPADAAYFHSIFNFPGLQGYRTLDFGSYLSIIMLDSDHTQRIEGAQANWLDNQIQNRINFSNIFPVYHVPGYPHRRDALPGRGLEVRETWTPIFEKYSLRLAFDHDNHGYRKTYSIKDNEVDGCGVRYIGGGGFAIGTGPADKPRWYNQTTSDVRHFLNVELTSTNRNIRTVSNFGSDIDFISQRNRSKTVADLNTTDINRTSTVIRWSSSCIVNNHSVDVATDINFNNKVSGYDGRSTGSQTALTINGLTPLTRYYARVRGTHSTTNFRSDYSDVLEFITEGQPPVAKSATNITSSSFIAHWDAVPGASNYRIDVATDPEFDNMVSNYENRSIGNVTQLSISNLFSSTAYYFRVRVDNPTINRQSANSNTVGVITSAQKPVLLDPIALNSSSIRIEWEALQRVNQYRVDIALDANFTNFLSGYNNRNVGLVTRIDVSGLTSLTTYYIRIRAENTDLNIVSVNSDTEQVTTLPAAPTNISISDIETNGFFVSWETANSQLNYQIDLATDSEFSQILPEYDSRLISDGLEYTFDDLDSSTEYFFRIRSVNQTGNLRSNYSATFRVATTPDQPEFLPITNLSETGVTIAWSEIDRITEYRFDIATDSEFENLHPSYSNKSASTETEIDITELTALTTYYVRVRALNTALNVISDDSETLELITLPEHPFNLQVSGVGTSQFFASWETEMEGLNFVVDLALDESFDSIVSSYNNLDIGTATNLNFEGLLSSMTYYVRVRSLSPDRSLTSLNSDVVQIITIPDVPILNEPQSIRAVGFTATWLPVDRVTHYVIDIANDENFTSTYKNFDNYNVGDVNEFQIEDVLPDTRLYFRVRAVNTILNVTSENSVIQDVNTIAIDPVVSTFTADQTTVLANGIQESMFTATIRANDGELLDGVSVNVTAASGTSEIEIVQAVSDLNGVTHFKVRNNRAEFVEYTARAINVDLDQKIEIRFVPVAPAVQSASSIVASTFQANWEAVNGAESYRIDVSEDENFNTFLNGFEDLNVDDALLYTITGLFPGNEYFYRVRAIAPTGTSTNSVVISVITPEADANLSGVTIQEPLILADNMSTGLIELTIRGENGEVMEGVPVQLETDNTDVVISSDLEISDQDGRVSFEVKSDFAGKVEFTVIAGRVSLATKAIVDFVPIPPVAVFPELLGAIEFTARWESVNGATHYLLDVARDENFDQLLDGYQDLDVGDEIEFKIVGLTSGATYFYRVRAATETTTSQSSNTIEVTTYRIDVENSTVVPSMKKILANGDQHSLVTIVLISDTGEPLSDVLVTLVPANPDHLVTIISDVTDDEGTATFEIRSSTAGEGSFQVFAGGLELDTTVNIIFLFADGEIKLGNNYPNPFGTTTKIPVTIPERMDVQLFVYNSNGLMVDKLEDREFVAGYYEIEFRPRGLSSGVYFVRMIADGKVLIEKMMLVK